MAGNGAEAGRTVTSKVVAILMAFTDGSMHSLTELVRLTGLPTSTAHRLANELTALGVLERADGGRYRVGTPLRDIGTRARHYPTVLEWAPRVMDDLSSATRTEVRFGVLDELAVAFIEKPPGHRPTSPFTADATLPAHATALGKALLAFSPPAVVDRVIAAGLTPFTRYTVTSPDRLRRALAVTRLTRIAVSRWEFEPASAIAAPVFGANGQVIGALQLRVRDLRSDLRAMQPALIVAARSLSREVASGVRSGWPDACGPPVSAMPFPTGAEAPRPHHPAPPHRLRQLSEQGLPSP